MAKKIDKIGMRCSDTAQIYFEDVRVPQDHVIGEEGMGFTYQMLQFQEERLYGAAASKPLSYLYVRLWICITILVTVQITIFIYIFILLFLKLN